MITHNGLIQVTLFDSHEHLLTSYFRRVTTETIEYIKANFGALDDGTYFKPEEFETELGTRNIKIIKEA